MWKNPNRLAVSQIIGALLLIALAVASAVLFYVYAIGLMGTLQTSGGSQMKDELELESYNWQTVSVLVLNVRNVGSTVINLQTADFSVNGVLSTWTINCPVILQPKGTCVISLTVPNPVTVGESYPVKIVLSDGAVFAYSATCGKSG